MSLLRMAYVVALRRTISNWRLELVLFLGIVLAVALMSSGVIFSDLVAEAALSHTLGRAPPEDVNTRIRVFIGSETPPTVSGRVAAYHASLDFVDHRVDEVQGWLVALVLVSLAGATGLSLILASMWAQRLRVPEVLRTGE